MKKAFLLYSDGKVVRVYEDEIAARGVVETVQELLPGLGENLRYEAVPYHPSVQETKKRKKRSYPDEFEKYWVALPEEQRKTGKFTTYAIWDKERQ